MRLLRPALALLLILPLAGCPQPSANTPPQAIAPGYISPADQQMAEILSGSRTFYNTVQCETRGLNWSQPTAQCMIDPSITKPLLLTATEKAAFNDFGTTLNIAETAHLAYHYGMGTLATAQSAVTATQQKQTSLPPLAVTK